MQSRAQRGYDIPQSSKGQLPLLAQGSIELRLSSIFRPLRTVRLRPAAVGRFWKSTHANFSEAKKKVRKRGE